MVLPQWVVTMFLLRSAFWLILAFMVIRPEMDMRDTASALTSEAMARGSQFIAQQIDAIECDTLQCAGGKAIATVALTPAPVPAGAGTPSARGPAVPLPRPRPDRLG